MRTRFWLPQFLLAAVVMSACTDRAHITEPFKVDVLFTIADAERGFKAGFYWLPPMVKNPSVSGTFDGGLEPEVQICALDGEECGNHLVTFTMEGSGSDVIRLVATDEHYIVNWHTGEYDLSESTHYRISVFAGEGVLLGFADVQPASNGKEMRNVDTEEYIGLIDGHTLPVKFRIETGIVASITVSPEEATVAPGESQLFTASVFDLHGEPVSATVTWESDDETVATVNQDGLATGVAEGEATITASAEQISGGGAFRVLDPIELVSVSAGNNHTCGLDADGVAYCWGHGGNGKLGDGSTTTKFTPVPVSTTHTFTSISAGNTHTCALTPEGAAFCWGSAGSGRLGNGASFGQELTPVPVSGNHAFAVVSASNNHTCGVTTAGVAYCWGSGSFGRLGDGVGEGGTGVLRTTPFPVSGGLTFAAISAGEAHTCGVTTDGDAYCWGSGGSGRLGNGDTDERRTPALVSGDHTFASITASSGHTCGITTAGTALCWGNGGSGRLGTGEFASHHTPTPVSGGHAFSTLLAGPFHTCGITTAGAALCWGTGGFGRIGDGDSGTHARLTPVPVDGDHTFADLSVGFTHNCAATTASAVYCWGNGADGRLGNGAVLNRVVPTRVGFIDN